MTTFLWMCQIKYILTEDEIKENSNFVKIMSINEDKIDKIDNAIESTTKESLYRKGGSKNEIDNDVTNMKNTNQFSNIHTNLNEKKKNANNIIKNKNKNIINNNKKK